MVNLLLSLNNFDENWCYSILKNIIKDNHNVLIIPFSYDDNWLKDEKDWNRAFSSEYGTHYKEYSFTISNLMVLMKIILNG